MITRREALLEQQAWVGKFSFNAIVGAAIGVNAVILFRLWESRVLDLQDKGITCSTHKQNLRSLRVKYHLVRAPTPEPALSQSPDPLALV